MRVSHTSEKRVPPKLVTRIDTVAGILELRLRVVGNPAFCIGSAPVLRPVAVARALQIGPTHFLP